MLVRALAYLMLLAAPALAGAQDYERESRWDEQTLAALDFGDAVHLEQANKHRFLGLYLRAANERGAVVIAHGRGWSPNYDLYGDLRVRLADAGYSTLSIQMPVLPSSAKIGDYLPTFPDADERLSIAIAWLRSKGSTKLAIVSHSLGATMANHYLINAPKTPVDACVFISIINGLEDMFRIKIPVLDVYGSQDWDVTRFGADERKRQILKVANSRQAVIDDARHFYEGKRDVLAHVIVDFLDRVPDRH
jgi:pimeloyl-ACP methyl ester carboxylesterase